jgi:potassium efflux system protein
MRPDESRQPPGDSRSGFRAKGGESALDGEARAEAPQDELALKVEAALKDAEGSESLDEDTKNENVEYLRKAQKWLASAEEYATKAAQYATEAEEAPQRLAQAKAELAQALPDPAPQCAPDAKLTQLEQALSQAEEELNTLKEELKAQEESADSKTQTDRKAELAEQKEAAKAKLQEAEDELKVAASREGGDGMTMARRLELQARQRALKSQIKFIDAERARSEALVELFPIERDLGQRRAAWQEKLVEAWREVVAEYRKAESERQAAEARRIASQAHPAVRNWAEGNARLAESRTKLAKDLEQVAGYLETVQATLADLEEDFAKVTEKVEVAGMTPTVGLLLRNRRDRLPDVREHRKRIKFSGAEMQRAQVALLELENERSQMGDLEERIEQVIAELGGVIHQFKPGYLETMVRELLYDRRDYLDSLLSDYRSYHDDLNNLDLATRDLLKQIETYRSYIDEHVLWIRSTHRLGQADLSNSWQALRSFMDLGTWGVVFGSTLVNVTSHPLASLVLVLACVGLFVFRRRIRIRLEAVGKRVAEEDGTSIAPTLQAFVLTIFMAALGPLMFWGLGWWMALNQNAPDLALGLANGLKSMAAIFFVLELLRQTCRPGGLAEKHFHWQPLATEVFYVSLNGLMLFGLPMLFLVSLIEAHDGGAWKDSLGRMAFLFGLFVLTVFVHDILRPWKGALQVALAHSALRWPSRLRYVWYGLGVGFPVTLGVLLALGYGYTADQFMLRFGEMVCLVVVLLFAQALLSRGLAVAWKRLMELRAALEYERPAVEHQEASTDASPEQREEEMRKAGAQLHQLVRAAVTLSFLVGIWFIWNDMFPALQVLDRVELWSTTRMVTETITSADGVATIEQAPKLVPTTLADLMFSIIAVMATLVMARTLPGVLEIAVLGRLPIDHGARHAIIIICRYVVTLFGVIMACRMLGMTWSSVQWLAAAMTVGLGFGLQEIFANLVSGLIILFERPIRIGDLVTVNGTTGKVTRMQIRATTITDFDRRELVVPNKRFITDDVVNWTLSDPVTRFVIPVGISYDSDPTTAHELLLKIGAEHPLVLDEPKPSAVFTGFGASTLDLELRAFVGSRDHFVTVLHELNTRIERAFREQGIEIAFPQQDLHIRSLSGVFPMVSPQSEEGTKKAA